VALIFTQLDYDAAVPGSSGSGRVAHSVQQAAVYYAANRIYQWHHKSIVTGLSAGDPTYDFWAENTLFTQPTFRYNSAALVTLDMTTMSEISRVEPDFSQFMSISLDADATADLAGNTASPYDLYSHTPSIATNVYPGWIRNPVAVPGTDWVVSSFYLFGASDELGGLSPYFYQIDKVLSVNSATGAMNVFHVPFVSYIELPGAGTYPKRYGASSAVMACAPITASTSAIVLYEAEPLTDGFFFRILTLDNATGIVNAGSSVPAPTLPNPVAPFVFINYSAICSGASGAGANFYVVCSNLADSVGDRLIKKSVYEISVDAVGGSTYTLLTTITESLTIHVEGIHYVASDNSVIVSYCLSNGTTKLKKIDATTGSVLVSATPSNISALSPFNATARIRVSDFSGQNVQSEPASDDTIFGIGGNRVSEYLNRYYQIDTDTLTATEWPVFASYTADLDNVVFTGGDVGFLDEARNGIWYPENYDPSSADPNALLHWVLITTTEYPGGGGGGGDNFTATITASIGQFSSEIRAIAERPCPVIGHTSFGTCVTGRSYWPPGIRQIISGRDDVALHCDVSTGIGVGAASGVGTATGVSGVVGTIAEAVGSAHGVGDAGANNTAMRDAVGNASGVGITTSISDIVETIAEAIGAAYGVGTADANDATTRDAIGNASGVGITTSISSIVETIAETIGIAYGVGISDANNTTMRSAVGNSSGAGVALGSLTSEIGEGIIFSGVGFAHGVGVTGILGGAAIAATIALAIGLGGINGVADGEAAVVGSATSIGTSLGVGVVAGLELNHRSAHRLAQAQVQPAGFQRQLERVAAHLPALARLLVMAHRMELQAESRHQCQPVLH
jgi:hypothetical protein